MLTNKIVSGKSHCFSACKHFVGLTLRYSYNLRYRFHQTDVGMLQEQTKEMKICLLLSFTQAKFSSGKNVLSQKNSLEKV